MIRGLSVLAAGFIALTMSAGSALASTGGHPFLERATSVEVSQGAPNCRSTQNGCEIISIGSVSGVPIKGSFQSQFVVHWLQGKSNGKGGFCAPSGGAALLGNSSSSLVIAMIGTFCEVGKTGPNVAHTFTGIFLADAGSGTFTNPTGVGIVRASDDGQGNLSVLLIGQLNY